MIGSQENLTRFIFSSSHFSAENNRLKHNAFLPAPNGETSVSRIDELPAEDIWKIGGQISVARKQTLYGRGDIPASKVFAAGLDAVPAEPPPHHAIIVKWPTEKSSQKLKAMELANNATLILR